VDHAPEIDFVLPLASENRWSDLLAVLVATDPLPIHRLLGLGVDHREVTVRREVTVDAANRPDLILMACGKPVAVIEVKVLAELGTGQLTRYAEAIPNAAVYALIFPERLSIDVHNDAWQGLTWERVLEAYTASTHAWTATTARAWLNHLDSSLPKVDRMTVWNALSQGEDFVVALRARMVWLHRNLAPAASIRHDLVSSSAGVSWVVRMFADAAELGYRVMLEIEESLSVREFRNAGLDSPCPRGPSIKVVLLQSGVTTSANFNWDYLHAMWPAMRTARTDWVTNTARPKAAHDRAGQQSIVAKGAPGYLGVGFGEAQTKINGTCMFGARLQLRPDIKLSEILDELRILENLIVTMANVVPPQPEPTDG
jgi:hypothetical protein